ncbi:DUF885 domain-containing protein [Biformimicrobium ophioploci]|uniref:DUF885 domain-containing protein n=1 Tax=Biformimicrobium ophioploci TaxID=3036711 RepID=A0ABQ6LXS7_9GAMM|nr:DUF885 domain-containing protein [Microbulbifer sp. NKW57]GMG86836.1 DUF885 domain-containing protein [Microbulbifer sp. NKW57]
MKHTLGILALAITVAACGQKTDSPDPVTKPADLAAEKASPVTGKHTLNQSDFEQFSDAMVAQLWRLFPTWAISQGYYDVDSELSIPDAAHREKVAGFARSYLTKIGGIDPSQLDASARSDQALIRNFLEKALWDIETFKSHEWDPSSYNVSHGFALLANTDYKPLDERMRTISQRMEKVPAYYQAAKSSITTPAKPLLELAIQQNEGALTVFGDTLKEQLEVSGLNEEEKAAFRDNLKKAKAAIEGYVGFLKEKKAALDANNGYRSFRIGEDFYEQKFKYDIQIGMSGRELYDRALTERTNIHDKMSQLADKLWGKYFPDQEPPADKLQKVGLLLEKLSENHATKENFKAEVEKQIPELEKFVTEKDLLTLDPEKPLIVRTTPPYMRGYAVASINAPGPYDKGANTYYNVMPIHEFPDDKAESFLREYNSYLMQILNIHEAIPGHYTQLIYANKSPSLIKSIFANGAMIEGWAVYTERMMLEAGYGDFEPELWLMYYKWNLRVITNTIIDYGIQVLGMTEEEAVKAMMELAFQQEAEARGKWRRATLSQVQLTSYFAGFADILALRDEMKEKLGDKFDLKAFHEQFLSYGNAPVPVIRKLMLDGQ